MNKNLKKIATCSMALMFATSLVACGNNTKPVNGGNDKKPVANSTELSESNQESGHFKSKLLPNTYKTPLQDVYVDLPNYQFIKEGYIAISIVHELKYTAFVRSKDHKAENAKDAFKYVFEDFKIDLKNYEGGPNEFEIEKERVETINGIETYFVEGKIHYGEYNPYEGYAIGYTFVFDDTPFGIFGSVTDKSQPEDAKKEIKQVVMDMMKTVRNKE